MSTTDSDTSSLRTLTDSFRQQLYRYQGDRRFQVGNEDYIWPCDKTAASVELISAYVLGKTFENGVHWEPAKGAMDEVLKLKERRTSVDGTPRLLDLGSGTTATWCISMAERYPQVECIGVDLVPSELSYLPANVSIEIHDLLEGLPYPDEYFNLIHCRFGGASSFLPSDGSNTTFLADIYRVLRPGGILLLEEVDNMLSPFRSRSPFNPYVPQIQARHALRFASRHPRALAPMAYWGTHMGPVIRGLGWFESVIEASVELPLGTRPNEGPSKSQKGCVQRDGWLDVWELQSAGMGVDETTIRELRRMDELAFPVEDVGVFTLANIVWARNGES